MLHDTRASPGDGGVSPVEVSQTDLLPPLPHPCPFRSYYCINGGCSSSPGSEGLDTAGCPLGSHPAQLADNAHCTLCMTCVKACPNRSVEFRWATHPSSCSGGWGARQQWVICCTSCCQSGHTVLGCRHVPNVVVCAKC